MYFIITRFPETVRIFLKKHVPVLCLSCLIVILAVLASDTAYLTIELTGTERNHIQVFWSTRSNNYSEARSIKIPTREGRRIYSFALQNALFIKRVRIDLQQGKGEAIPKPILLHSIRYSFNGMFKGGEFDSSLKGIHLEQGIQEVSGKNNNEKIIFTQIDPIMDFEMRIQPVYSRMIIPVLFMLLLHSIIISSFFQGKKNRYKIEFVMQKGRENAIKGLNSVLKNNGIQYQCIQLTTSQEEVTLQYAIESKSIPTLYTILAQVSSEQRMIRLNIVANRSGEIA